jgi:hypothetical protein
MSTAPHPFVAPADPKRHSCGRCARRETHPVHRPIDVANMPKSLEEVRDGLLEIRDGFPANSRYYLLLTTAHEALDPEPYTLGEPVKRPEIKAKATTPAQHGERSAALEHRKGPSRGR